MRQYPNFDRSGFQSNLAFTLPTFSSSHVAMAKAPKPPKEAPAKEAQAKVTKPRKTRKKQATEETESSTANTLLLTNSTLQEGHFAKNTQGQHSSAMGIAHRWLAAQKVPSPSEAGFVADSTEQSDLSVLTDPNFFNAFKTAHSCTPEVIAMHMTHRIVEEKLGVSILNQIKAAFKEHFQLMYVVHLTFFGNPNQARTPPFY